MSQITKRRSTPQTRTGQYMCPKCGKIFDTKTQVDSHIHRLHKPRVKSVLNGVNGYYTE